MADWHIMDRGRVNPVSDRFEVRQGMHILRYFLWWVRGFGRFYYVYDTKRDEVVKRYWVWDRDIVD
jgi:intergrase/recombinase